MKRQITCIVCPRGCILTAEQIDGKILVTGNSCQRGEQHAITECTAPVRSITSTVRVSNRADTMVSVKTADPVAKEKIFQVMALIRGASVAAPVHIGDVILTDVFGTQVIATKEIN